MFIDEKTQTKIHANLNETVIHATLRPQDLIPVFLEVIKDTPEYVALMNEVPSHVLEDDDAEYWESEECSYLLNETLIDILNQYAPTGYYFGCTEGNGSDFGYWELDMEE